MIDPIVWLLVAGFVAATTYRARRGQRKVEAALQRSFDDTMFDTPGGKVPGSSLKVVKISEQSTRFAGEDVHKRAGSTMPSDAFWYCVGPGPSYFLAIATAQVGDGRVSVEWIIRPLTEQRMRGALAGDRKATALAFGNAAEM
jgi:hypothetical protein